MIDARVLAEYAGFAAQCEKGVAWGDEMKISVKEE
jgi:hypothetical protein